MSKQTADFSAVIAESQKQALAAITQAHESMLTLARWGMGGSMPATAASAWSLPKATDVVQAGYDFAGKVLEEHKAFALRLTEIASARVEDVKQTVA